jgi:hypothetical protein
MDVLQELRTLFIDSTFHTAGRNVDLCWFSFTLPLDGNKKIVSFNLHVQCSWRITIDNVIIVASKDKFYPRGDPYQGIDSFDWTVPFSSQVDEKLALLFDHNKYPEWTVLSADIDNYGGVIIKFSANREFSIYPDNSLGGEFWRLLPNDHDLEHFVITRRGIERE